MHFMPPQAQNCGRMRWLSGRVAAVIFPPSWLETLSGYRPRYARASSLLPDDQEHRTFYAYTPDGTRDDTQPAEHFARIGQALPPELVGYVHSTPQQDDPRVFEPLALRPEDWPHDYAG